MSPARTSPLGLDIPPRLPGRGVAHDRTAAPRYWSRFGLFYLLAVLGVAAVVLPFLSGTAAAIAITITDPNKRFVHEIPKCERAGVTYIRCRSTAFIASSSLTGDDDEFEKSFNAWNATNAAGSKWTLANGGNLPGGKFEVDKFRAIAEYFRGGVEIDVLWSDYTGADRNDFYWSQGIYDNYSPATGGFITPIYKMDVNATTGATPPLYPFQYTDRSFYDKPEGPWPNAFFLAEAFLSKADYTNRVLTIYEGLQYGFRLSVPEPPVVALFGVGLLVILALRRRLA